RNSDQIVKAEITYAELLGKWNSALDATKATQIIAQEVRTNGTVVGLVIPLATLFDMARLTERSDIAAIAGMGISFVNPSVAREMCQIAPFSIEAIGKPLGSVPQTLSGYARFAFLLKSRLEKMPAAAKPSTQGVIASAHQAMYGDASAWKQS